LRAAPAAVLALLLLALPTVVLPSRTASTGGEGAPSLLSFVHPAFLVDILENPINHDLYVTNSGGGTVAVIDPSAGTVMANVDVGVTPWGEAADPSTGDVFVTCFGLQVPGEGMSSPGAVYVVSPANVVLRSAHIALGATGAAFDPKNDELYVALSLSHTVEVLDVGSMKSLANITVPQQPDGVLYDPGNGQIYVSQPAFGFVYGDTLSEIDPTSNTVVRNLTVGSGPEGMAYDAASREILLALSQADAVEMINDTTGSVSAAVNLPGQPWGVAFDSVSGLVYVSVSTTNQVAVVDPAKGLLDGSIDVVANPYGVAYSQAAGTVFVAGRSGGYVDEVSPSLGRVTVVIGEDRVGLGFQAVGTGAQAGPVVTYFQNGVEQIVHASLGLQAYFADPGTTLNVSGTLQGSGPVIRWASPTNTSLYVSQSENDSVTFYGQDRVDFSFVTTPFSLPQGAEPPTVAYTAFGQHVTSPMNLTTWVDNNTAYGFSGTVSASPNSRWEAAEAGGSISGPGSATVTYFAQYPISISYHVAGGDGGFPPGLRYTYVGAAARTLLALAPTTVWLDEGTTWSADSLLQKPATQFLQRYISNATSGVASGPADVTLLYYHQYQLTVSARFAGSATPTTVALKGVSFGEDASWTLGASPLTVWLDGGTTWSVPDMDHSSIGGADYVLSGASSGAANGTSLLNFDYSQEGISTGTSAGHGAGATPLSVPPGVLFGAVAGLAVLLSAAVLVRRRKSTLHLSA
jgi:YVTN family beta-propeller protein